MVKIALTSLPTERYKRNVIRGKLDLVGKHFRIDLWFSFIYEPIMNDSCVFVSVSMGGTTGLFVGASLLSFVEIFYYFVVRPYYNLQQEW